jgi:hypothetical protein
MYHPTLNQTQRCAGQLLPMVLLTADEFDAWMKANGIRVAKGNGQDAAAKPVVVASKDEPKGKKKKK